MGIYAEDATARSNEKAILDALSWLEQSFLDHPNEAAKLSWEAAQAAIVKQRQQYERMAAAVARDEAARRIYA